MSFTRQFAFWAKFSVKVFIACLLFTSCNNRVSKISTTEITLKDRQEKVFNEIVAGYDFDENLKEEFSSELQIFLTERADELTHSTTLGKVSRKDKKRFSSEKFGEFYENQLMKRGNYVLSDFISRESIATKVSGKEIEPPKGSMLAKIKEAEEAYKAPPSLKEEIKNRIKLLEIEIGMEEPITVKQSADSPSPSVLVSNNIVPEEFEVLAEEIVLKKTEIVALKAKVSNVKAKEKKIQDVLPIEKKETIITDSVHEIVSQNSIKNELPETSEFTIKERTTGIFNDPDSGMYFGIITFLLASLALGIRRTQMA